MGDGRPTALVTGAGHRLGAAIARRLADSGHRVVLHAFRHHDVAAALAAELSGVALPPDCADLTADGGPERLMAATLSATGGRLEVLVNNAALFERGPAESLTPAAWALQLSLNLTVPFRLCQLAAPALRAASPRPGCIVNLIDICAERPYAGTVAYSATKAALATVTRGLAAEWGPHIRVNGVSPGAALFPDTQGEAARAQALARSPLGRETGAAAIAEAVDFLISGPVEINGVLLTVDGGRSARF